MSCNRFSVTSYPPSDPVRGGDWPASHFAPVAFQTVARDAGVWGLEPGYRTLPLGARESSRWRQFSKPVAYNPAMATQRQST
jgi:hypothetical protein